MSDTVPEPKKPALDLWIDVDEFGVDLGWNQPIEFFDFDRFRTDDRYAAVVSSHIAKKLEQLAKEIQEISVVMPIVKRDDVPVDDWFSCRNGECE